MKKKFLVFIAIVCLLSSGVFAENRAGANKLGVYLGWPLGLSYSHNFTTADQLDLVAAVGGFNYWGYGECWLMTDIGYLRSVFQSNLGGAVCPFELGFGGGLVTWFHSHGYAGLRVRVFGDLRWEVFFAALPHFNLFLDFAPGVEILVGNSANDAYNPYHTSRVYFSNRGGLGLRFQF